MNGTWEIIRGSHGRSPFPHPAFRASGRPHHRGSRRARGLRQTLAWPGNGSLAIFRVPSAVRNRFFVAVAYSRLAHSRLGYSPNLSLNAAYHNTSCKFQENTNPCLNKKSRGLSIPSLAVPSVCSVGQRTRDFSPAADAVGRDESGISCNQHIFKPKPTKDKIYVESYESLAAARESPAVSSH